MNNLPVELHVRIFAGLGGFQEVVRTITSVCHGWNNIARHHHAYFIAQETGEHDMSLEHYKLWRYVKTWGPILASELNLTTWDFSTPYTLEQFLRTSFRFPCIYIETIVPTSNVIVS